MSRIAIQPDDTKLTSGRRQSFSARWVELLESAGHVTEIVDVYSADFFDRLAGCDGFMWFFGQRANRRRLGKRLLPAIEHGLGIPVFPSWRTSWHFDDKVSQAYLFGAAGIPTPRTWVLWDRDEALRFVRQARYPLVLKLAGGITSKNVTLLRDAAEAEIWIGRMFGPGLTSLAKPTRLDRHNYRARLRDAARLLRTGDPPPRGRTADVERDYVYLQEFLEGNAYDTRITIIGDRAFAFRRHNRPGDFRASGSGRIDWDQSEVSMELVRLAFRVAETLGTQAVAVDGMWRGGEPVIGEISYYYEGWALAECPGTWRLRGHAADGQIEWVEGRVRPEDAILEDFLALVARQPTLRPGNAASSR